MLGQIEVLTNVLSTTKQTPSGVLGAGPAATREASLMSDTSSDPGGSFAKYEDNLVKKSTPRNLVLPDRELKRLIHAF